MSQGFRTFGFWGCMGLSVLRLGVRTEGVSGSALFRASKLRDFEGGVLSESLAAPSQ